MAASRATLAIRKVAFAIAGLALFVLALQVLKAGARPLGPFIVGTLGVDSALSSLGFGWIFAYIVLSGSPVAAIALTFFASGVINALQTFTMIAGSRFGAAFVVLLLGFLYAVRGKSHRQSLEMGVLSLLTTYAVYGIAVPLGLLVLASGLFSGFRIDLPPVLFDAIDAATVPAVELLMRVLRWPALVFAAGVGAILVAFTLFDKALPDLSAESPIRNLEAHIYRPTVMFALGSVITLLTLSVSVSLGLLVPLSAKGIARRENVIPYIMGANVTTFIDTLFATLLIDEPDAFAVVFVEMASVLVVSAVILYFYYGRFERILLALSKRILATRASLGVFLATILLFPLLLLVL